MNGVEVGPEHPRELRLTLHARVELMQSVVLQIMVMRSGGPAAWQPGLIVAEQWFRKRLDVLAAMLEQAYEQGFVSEEPP